MDTSLLTEAGRNLLTLNAPNAYRRLVVDGDGDPAARERLKRLTPTTVLAKPIVRSDEGQAVLGGLWLWHDWLDESHTISQGIQTATGSYWHAIMHRREGDFSNSKYWYAKCRRHPVAGEMAKKAADIVRQAPGGQKLSAVLSGGWDPDAFVDLAEEASSIEGDPRMEALIALQRAEWECLFELSCQAAV
jgi:hypothetical protein